MSLVKQKDYGLALKSVKVAGAGKARDAGKIQKSFWFSVPEKINMVNKGVSKKQLADVKSELELDYEDIAEILGVSRVTLINKKAKEKFNRQISERILLISDLMGYGQHIFGDRDTFNEWLKSPSEALGNITPLSSCNTIYGIEEIRKELGRIAHGVY